MGLPAGGRTKLRLTATSGRGNRAETVQAMGRFGFAHGAVSGTGRTGRLEGWYPGVGAMSRTARLRYRAIFGRRRSTEAGLLGVD